MKQTGKRRLLAAALLVGLCLAGCGEATGGTTAAAERESTSMRAGAESTASAQTSTVAAVTNTETAAAGTEPAETLAALAPEDIQWGQVYLCGEWKHGNASMLTAELALWGERYAQGWRDLFEEISYADAYYLNQWMQADSDQLLTWLYDCWEGTSAHSPAYLDYYRQIKQKYPETVFHGTDVGQDYDLVGARLKSELERAGKENTKEYLLLLENNQQGEALYRLSEGSGSADKVYRETCMAGNFLREYGALSGANIMGIYGSAHTVNDKRCSGEVDTMTKQLLAYGGDAIQAEIIGYVDLLRTDRMEVRGKEYDATYYGFDEYSQSDGMLRMDYWRLENAYDDLADCPYADEDTAYWSAINYFYFPLKVEERQVYAVKFTKPDGSVEQAYYRTDGNVIDKYLCAQCIVVDD